MLISVPVLSDRLKFKQTLPWAPLPNRCQSNTTIKKASSPPPLSSEESLLLSSFLPLILPSPSILSVSNRHCLNHSNTVPIHISVHIYSTLTSHQTWLCIPGCTGCYRAECPLCQQDDLQTIHGRCAHSHLPPSYSLSLLFYRHTVTFVRSFSMPEKLHTACSKECALST